MPRFSTSLLFLAIIASSVNAQTIANNNLTVTVSGLKKQSGQVCLSLFANSRGFPSSSDNALQSQCVKVGSVPLAITFRNLKAGSYAVSAIHDANDDSTLDRNFLGIPTEGVGFSRNPKIRVGPPKFNDSAILINASTTSIQIHLQYLLGG